MSMVVESTPLIAAYDTSNIYIISGLRLVIVNTPMPDPASVFVEDGERLKEASP